MAVAATAVAALALAGAGASGGGSRSSWRFELVSLAWTSTSAWRATSVRTDTGCPGVSPRSGRTTVSGAYTGRPAPLRVSGARATTSRLRLEIDSVHRGTYALVECGTRASLGTRNCARRTSARGSGAIAVEVQEGRRRAQVTWDIPVATFGDCIPTRIYDTADQRVAKLVASLRRQAYPLARLDVPRGHPVTLVWLGPELEWSVRQRDPARASTAGTFVWTARLVLRRL